MIRKPFERLKHICIEGRFNEINSIKIVTNLLEMAQQLNSLDIYSNGKFGMPINTLLNSIQHKRSITKLATLLFMEMPIPVNPDDVRQLINQYPPLVELESREYRLNVDDAIDVVDGLNSWTKSRFQMLRSEYTEFVDHLDVEWKAENHTINGTITLSKLAAEFR